MKAYILGGGPTGMALAHGLTTDADISFTVVERQEILGGLACTLDWDNHGSHDLGPHKIFTLDPDLRKRVRDLLPESEWITRSKKSSIYMRGHYLPYPPSPFSLSKVFGYFVFAKMVIQYGLAQVRGVFGKNRATTFKQDLMHRVGGELYDKLFSPIAQKLWGDPARLDVKLSKCRVQTPSILEVVTKLLGFKKQNNFEALEFEYPKGGLRSLWKSIYQQTRPNGEYLLGHEVVSIDISENRVTALKIKNLKDGTITTSQLGPEDFVFSSLPLAKLGQLMPTSIPPHTLADIKSTIQLNDLLLVFLKVEQDNAFEDSWIFIPDPVIPFHRVSEQESFDPGMTPNGSVICCEIMSHVGRPFNKKPDQDLVELSIAGLTKMGYGHLKVKASKVIRLPNSYPVYGAGFEEKLESILKSMDAISNFRTVGRQGSFNYIGTLDAMDTGYGAARWLAQTIKPLRTPRKAAWNDERKRTSHYAVLD